MTGDGWNVPALTRPSSGLDIPGWPVQSSPPGFQADEKEKYLPSRPVCAVVVIIMKTNNKTFFCHLASRDMEGFSLHFYDLIVDYTYAYRLKLRFFYSK